MRTTVASVYALASLFLAATPLFAGLANAETIKGQTVLASYQATGLCAESDRSTGQLHLAKCARKAEQDFHMERFDDIAQQVSWQKIMNGKNCLQAGYLSGSARLYVERCYITTWSKSAFWTIDFSGSLHSEEKYCPRPKDDGTTSGTALVANQCNHFAQADFYPAILTRSAKVGPQTLAAYTPGQQVKAIVIENGFSGGNLVASEGAFLKVDKSGNVSATSGGDIIAGGAGYSIENALSKVPGALILKPADYSSEASGDYAPRSLDFFKEEKERGRISYDPR